MRSGSTGRCTRPAMAAAALLLALLVVAGCTTKSVIVPSPLIDQQRSQEVLELLKAKAQHVRAMRALFQAEIRGSILLLSKTLPGIVTYRRPDQFHLRGLSRVGGTMFQFHRTGNQFQLFVQGNGGTQRGSMADLQAAGDMGRVVSLSLRAFDAVLGNVEGLDAASTKIFADTRGLRIDALPMVNADAVTQGQVALTRTWVSERSLDVVRVEYLDHEGDVLFLVECDDFRGTRSAVPVSDRSRKFPYRILAEDRELSGSVTLQFQEMVVNDGAS